MKIFPNEGVKRKKGGGWERLYPSRHTFPNAILRKSDGEREVKCLQSFHKTFSVRTGELSEKLIWESTGE